MANKLYRVYSPHMQSCDLIEWQSYGSPIGWAIRKFTGREANHTSIVIRPKEYGGFKDRRFLLEALGGGPVPRLLSLRLEGYQGRVKWLQLDSSIVNDYMRTKMAEWAITECVAGKRYDYGSLFRNMAGKVSVNAEKWFCSEYATGMFIAGGLLKKEVKAYRPGEFTNLPFIKNSVIIYDSILEEKRRQVK